MTLQSEHVLQDRYRVLSPLGEGGMGAVYRAWDTRLDVPVALKEMVPQPGLDTRTLAQLRQQFKQEATVLARLDHPHLVDVTDFFEEDGRVYLVMKFIEGESLAERIEREGALSEEEVLEWSEQLLDALAYCHSRGIIHRDVKPQNVIVRPDGQAVLVDFGLVKLWDPDDPRTKTAMRGVGTPEYAPPEQYEVELGHTDARSDIYGLGATMYHGLTGKAPPTATLRMANPEQFTPPRALRSEVSERTELAILGAMELARSERWQSTREMAEALELSAPTWEEQEGVGEEIASPLKGREGTGTRKMETGALSPTTQWVTRFKSIFRSQAWQRVGRFLWRATKWTLGKVAAVVLVLAIVLLVLAIGSSFVLGTVLEKAIVAQPWNWSGWERGGTAVVREEDVQQPLESAIELYALDSLSDVTADFNPPDIVELEGNLGERPLCLRGRLTERDGVLWVRLEKLNGVPLYIVGGIISNGMNQGFRSAWEDAPIELATLRVYDDRVRAVLDPVEGSAPSPTSTPASALVHVTNQLNYAVTVTVDGESFELDPRGETEIELQPGTYDYRVSAFGQIAAEGEISWHSGYQEWTIRD